MPHSNTSLRLHPYTYYLVLTQKIQNVPLTHRSPTERTVNSSCLVCFPVAVKRACEFLFWIPYVLIRCHLSQESTVNNPNVPSASLLNFLLILLQHGVFSPFLTSSPKYPNSSVRSTDSVFHCVNDEYCFVAIHLNRLEVLRNTSGTKLWLVIYSNSSYCGRCIARFQLQNVSFLLLFLKVI